MCETKKGEGRTSGEGMVRTVAEDS
jgi:hypothetical protein